MTWYQGLRNTRNYDLLMYRVTMPDSLSVAVARVFAEDGGLGVTGPHKLMQQVILSMLTRSNGYLFERNTNTFADKLLSGNIQNPLVFRQEFSLAIQDTLDNLGNLNPRYNQLPPDEKIRTMSLLAVTLANGVATMTVEVVTAAGEAFKYVVPQQVYSG
jgi:hypothetical protein